jgi:hypothetical protein
MDKGFELLMRELGRGNKTLCDFFRTVATHLGIEYKLSLETERVLEVRHEGRWIPSGHGGEEWDDGQTWSKDGWPDSFNTTKEALGKIGYPIAMWYHCPSMNLVIENDDGTKVGIRSTDFRIPLLGPKTDRLNQLVAGLRAKQEIN